MKKKVFATLLAVSMIASMVPAAVSVQAEKPYAQKVKRNS